jgi:dihydropteroate synthase
MTKFVGILNLTPDSFSDGGRFFDEKKALKQTQKLINQKVDIIDIVDESTRPGAIPLDCDEEWGRLFSILPAVIKMAHKSDVQISLDSRHHQSVKKALDLGIDIINDVTGFDDEDMVRLAAKSGKDIVVMHNLGVPAMKDVIIDEGLDEVREVYDWMNKKVIYLVGRGVKKENIIFDPGVGFGKSAKQSISILKNIEKFKNLDVRIFVGHSRKSFLDEIEFDKSFGENNRDNRTRMVSADLIKKGIDYLRVHDGSLIS